MVRRWHLLGLLVLCSGCETAAAIDRADIIAALAVRYGAVAVRNPAPQPDGPAGECDKDCKCNGTGKEKSGDGIAIVDCRCDDDCKCKASKAPESSTEESSGISSEEHPLFAVPPSKAPESSTEEFSGISSEEPPLVPIKSSSACESGNCERPQVGRRWRLFQR